MIILGITGGIAMGKSETLKLARQLGFEIISADALVHDLLAPGGAAEKQVKTAFPESVEKGAISRKKLGEIVFADDKKLSELEFILHPHVWQIRAEEIRRLRLRGVKRVAIEIPLLFETSAERALDGVISVTVPPYMQAHRVRKRGKLSRGQWVKVKARQLTAAKRNARADAVIYTGHGKAVALRALKAYTRKLCVRLPLTRKLRD